MHIIFLKFGSNHAQHGVVTPEVHAVTPSRMAAGMAELLGRTRAASVAI